MNRLISLGVVVCLLGSVGVAVANEAPLANAGLDQDVDQGEWVYLDASGSFDPDGDLAAYGWTIETPNGSVRTPECANCSQTSFQARQAGTYEVTVTVTDDRGATAEDKLFVQSAATDFGEEPAPAEPSMSSVSGGGGGSSSEYITYNPNTGNIIIYTDDADDSRPHIFTMTENGREYAITVDGWESLKGMAGVSVERTNGGADKVVISGGISKFMESSLGNGGRPVGGGKKVFYMTAKKMGQPTREAHLPSPVTGRTRYSGLGEDERGVADGRRTVNGWGDPRDTGTHTDPNDRFTENPNWNLP